MKQPYTGRKGAGVVAYALRTDRITIEFRTGETYLYTYASAGQVHIEQMKKLAEKGKGLTTYINQHVKNLYEQRID